MTPERLEEIRKRLQGTKDGPWKWVMYDGVPQLEANIYYHYANPVLTTSVCEACRERGAPCLSGTPEDRDFIAHARTDIPELLDYIEELEDALKPFTGKIENLPAHFSDHAAKVLGSAGKE